MSASFSALPRPQWCLDTGMARYCLKLEALRTVEAAALSAAAEIEVCRQCRPSVNDLHQAAWMPACPVGASTFLVSCWPGEWVQHFVALLEPNLVPDFVVNFVVRSLVAPAVAYFAGNATAVVVA